jgi:ABC-type methionine transport system ATPase subunit
MTFVRRVGEWVIVMDRGAIIEQGPSEQIFDAPTVDRTREFLSYLGWPGRSVEKRCTRVSPPGAESQRSFHILSLCEHMVALTGDSAADSRC